MVLQLIAKILSTSFVNKRKNLKEKQNELRKKLLRKRK